MKTVLLIDDSAIFLALLNKIVGQKLNVIATARDGNEGVEKYKAHKPDLVLMDVTMPNKNGKECLQEIMTINPNAKVIMVSGLADEQTMRDCLKLGAKSFVRKELLSASNTGENSELIRVIAELQGRPSKEAA